VVVLKYLLGYDKVRNYDGSWTEWGNAVKAPIEIAYLEMLHATNSPLRPRWAGNKKESTGFVMRDTKSFL
jgi:hypothetical protein